MAIPTYIVGAGGLGRGVLETVNLISAQSRNWEVKGFIDDNRDIHHQTIKGIQILGGIEYLLQIKTFSNVILAIANPTVKESIYNQLNKNNKIIFPNIIHPTVQVPMSAQIGCGNIISENVSFSADVKIGCFNLIHFNTSIGHDVDINDYVTVYPGVNLSGFAKLNNKSQIGTNAALLPGITIGNKSIVGASSLVNKDVQKNKTVVGIPAQELKNN